MSIVIPSTFYKLDTRVDAADAFADVRTMKVKRENHNILVARGLRRNVLNLAFNNKNGPTVVKAPTAVGFHDRPLLLSTGILVTQHCQKLYVTIRGCKAAIAGGTAGTPALYVVASTPTNRRKWSDGCTLSMTTANTSTESDLGTVSADLHLPMQPFQANMRDGFQAYILDIYAYTPVVTDATIITGKAITSIGDDWIVVTDATTTDNIGRLLIFSDTSAPPRGILHYDSGTGRTYTNRGLAFGWKTRPIVGTTTATIRDVTGINLYSLSVFEKSVSDFSAHGGW